MKIKPYSKICEICGKAPMSGFNKPHSLHKTKRVVKPNIQKLGGLYVCTRCQKTITKKHSSILSSI